MKYIVVVVDSTGRVYDTCVVQGLAKPVETTSSDATDATAETETGA